MPLPLISASSPSVSSQPLMLMLSPVVELMEHISALCASWSAISPGTAHATCVSSALNMCLDILLQAALSEDGLHDLHIEALVQTVVLCWTIVIMMMTQGSLVIENSEGCFTVQTEEEWWEFIFLGVDPKKVTLA
uniref:Uncharacterized protein n=1 Tax=Moniliophthora roreri TaxID=221103 RepID=A0A0W0FR49_MONRR